MDLQQSLDWARRRISCAMNKKIAQKLCLSLFLAVFIGCGNSIPKDDLSSFVIPPKDSELIYSFADGRLMHTRLVSIENSNVILEDAIEIQKDLQLPVGMTWSDLGVKEGYIKDRYSFIIKENQVIRQDKRGKQILLMGPLSPSGKKWKTRMVRVQNKLIVEQFAECKILDVEKQVVLKLQRTTLTVDCLQQTTDSGNTLFRIRFAKNLGIIEKSIYFSNDSKVQIDSTPPIEIIQLKQIRLNSQEAKKGNPERTYRPFVSSIAYASS